MPCVVYAARGVSLYRDQVDARTFLPEPEVVDHPCPRPLAVVEWAQNEAGQAPALVSQPMGKASSIQIGLS